MQVTTRRCDNSTDRVYMRSLMTTMKAHESCVRQFFAQYLEFYSDPSTIAMRPPTGLFIGEQGRREYMRSTIWHVASVNDAPVGVVAWSGHQSCGAPVVLRVSFVVPEFRRRGIRNQLVSDALAEMRAQGHRSVDACPLVENTALMRVLARQGFEIPPHSGVSTVPPLTPEQEGDLAMLAFWGNPLPPKLASRFLAVMAASERRDARHVAEATEWVRSPTAPEMTGVQFAAKWPSLVPQGSMLMVKKL